MEDLQYVHYVLPKITKSFRRNCSRWPTEEEKELRTRIGFFVRFYEEFVFEMFFICSARNVNIYLLLMNAINYLKCI